MALSIAPSSEVYLVRSWRCEVCGDYWIVRGKAEEKPVDMLIRLHLGLFHGGEAVKGKHLVWYVMRSTAVAQADAL